MKVNVQVMKSNVFSFICILHCIVIYLYLFVFKYFFLKPHSGDCGLQTLPLVTAEREMPFLVAAWYILLASLQTSLTLVLSKYDLIFLSYPRELKNKTNKKTLFNKSRLAWGMSICNMSSFV